MPTHWAHSFKDSLVLTVKLTGSSVRHLPLGPKNTVVGRTWYIYPNFFRAVSLLSQH